MKRSTRLGPFAAATLAAIAIAAASSITPPREANAAAWEDATAATIGVTGEWSNDAVFSGTTTPGTLGIAVADLDGDGRIDVVQSQGEVASPDKVFLGVDVAPDTSSPVVIPEERATVDPSAPLALRARIHDRKTPVVRHDFDAVALRWRIDDEAPTDVTPDPVGGDLWRAEILVPASGTLRWSFCATDAAGNETCTAELSAPIGTTPPDAGPPEPPDSGGQSTNGDSSGCGCRAARSGSDPDAIYLGALGAAVVLCLRATRRRRR